MITQNEEIRNDPHQEQDSAEDANKHTDNSANHNRISYGISKHFYNKENRAPKHWIKRRQRHDNLWAFASFPTVTTDHQEFIRHQLSGGAITPGCFERGRANKTWVKSQIIIGDFDDHVSVADCKKVSFNQQYAGLIYPSASSGKKRGYKSKYRKRLVAIRRHSTSIPVVLHWTNTLIHRGFGPMVMKTRVVYFLDQPMTSEMPGGFETYRTGAMAVLQSLGLDVDPASFKPAQFYYGSDNCVEQPYINLDAVLPLAVVNQLAEELCRADKQARNCTDNDHFEPKQCPVDDEAWTTKKTDNLEWLVPKYRASAVKQNSRNKGLFETSCVGRDWGCSQSEVEAALVSEHISYPPLGPHVPETTEERRDEALRTIASAFSRPPRARVIPDGVPTSVREHLLQNKKGSVLRVLETLRRAGLSTDDIISRADAIRLCDNMGNKTVRSALEDVTVFRLVSVPTDGGEAADAFFSHLVTVQEVVVDSASSEKDGPDIFVSSCPSNRKSKGKCIVQGDKTTLKSRGRPSSYYQMRSIDELCAAFGVTDQRSDPLPDGALSSPKAYRRAVQEALIKRRPDQYSQRWLSKRVGVSPRTNRRDMKENENIEVEQRVDKKLITETNLMDVPADLEPGEQWGHWLQDESGKKYKPLRGIAQYLLEHGHQVWYCTQLRNFYQHVDNVPRPVEPPQAHEDHTRASQQSTESVNSSESANFDGYQKQGA